MFSFSLCGKGRGEASHTLYWCKGGSDSPTYIGLGVTENLESKKKHFTLTDVEGEEIRVNKQKLVKKVKIGDYSIVGKLLVEIHNKNYAFLRPFFFYAQTIGRKKLFVPTQCFLCRIFVAVNLNLYKKLNFNILKQILCFRKKIYRKQLFVKDFVCYKFKLSGKKLYFNLLRQTFCYRNRM